jgi:hypothetical protein
VLVAAARPAGEGLWGIATRTLKTKGCAYPPRLLNPETAPENEKHINQKGKGSVLNATSNHGREEDIMNDLLEARPWPQGGMKRSIISRAIQSMTGSGDPKSSKKSSPPPRWTRPPKQQNRKAKDKKRKEALDEAGNKIAAGMVSGVSQAALFHPWDRALYLAQTNQRCTPHTLKYPSPSRLGPQA